MKELHRRPKALAVFALALGCALLAGVWPQWRDELQGYGTYGQLPTHKPYIKYCYVTAMNTPTGLNTDLHIAFSTPDFDINLGYIGNALSSGYSISVAGPNSFRYDFDKTIDYPSYGMSGPEYSKQLSSTPDDGLYTFTVTAPSGSATTSYYYLTKGATVPTPDVTTFNAISDLSGLTLSWSAISGYDGNLSYRVKFYYSLGTSPGSPVMTSTVVNATSFSYPGMSTPPTGYTWTVEAFDKNSEKISNSGSTELPPISFTFNNTLPYFNQASVYTAHSWSGAPDGMFQTGLWAQVGVPSGTLSALTVSDQDGSPYYSFDVSKCTPNPIGSLLTCYGYTDPPSPTPPDPATVSGTYTFKATNEYGNATSSFYRSSYAVPLVDPTTCKASGDPTGPVLSWSTPETAIKPLYYNVSVSHPSSTTPVWVSSGWTSNTSVKVPSGTLTMPTGEYLWWVNAYDGQNLGTANASFSTPQTLTMNTTDPYSTFANVHARTNPDGKLYIFFDVQVADPDGTLPTSIASLKVKDPDSVEYDLKGGWDPAYNEFYIQQLGTPKEGKYTFTVRDTDGHNATTYKYHRTGDGPIPMFDENSIQASGTPLAPTISWSNIKSSTATGYPGRLYYIVQINDQQGNTVYNSSWSPDTYVIIPPGKLASGRSYQYRVRAQDANNFMAIDNRVNSGWHWLPTIKGDFDLDGKPDLLWRNTSSGANLLWYMNGATRIGSATLNAVADLNWAIVGTGDFNGDGKPDILWRNTSNGMNVVWYMNGATRIGAATLNTVADLNWAIVGTDDFNGDGKPDILWRNTSNGMNVVWYMNGATRIGAATLNTVPDRNWVVVGTGDFNGDGKPDLLWKNTSAGMNVVVVWYMNGTTLADWGYYNCGLYSTHVPGLVWSLVGISDVDGDGYPDTIWRNTSTGTNRVVRTISAMYSTSSYSYYQQYYYMLSWMAAYYDLPAVSNLSWSPVSR
jgi:hypothetical protein